MRTCSTTCSVRTRRRSAQLLVLALLLATLVPGRVLASDSTGTEFWVAFPTNLDEGQPLNLDLLLASATSGSGVVEIPGLQFSEAFTVQPGAVTRVDLPAAAMLTASDGIEQKGIHIRSNVPVSAYGLNQRRFTTDAFTAVPVPSLGTEHLVMSWPGPFASSQLAVVGTVDGTQVVITTPASPGQVAAVRTVTLGRGEVYQLQSTGGGDLPADLTGTAVDSTAPVSVFGAHVCANVPDANTHACDHLVEQMPPTSAWGTRFLSFPLATRQGGDTFRILASADDTTVSVNGAAVATLARGQFHQQIIEGGAQIEASRPVLVAQYSNGTGYDEVTSDPFMMLVPPFEQYLASYTVSTPEEIIRANFVNVIAPNGVLGQVRVDGVAVDPASFTPIAGTSFSGLQREVGLGSHTVDAPAAIGLFVYGFDEFDSYGYPGGFGTAAVATISSLSLSPETAGPTVGEEQCHTTTLSDSVGDPVSGARVDYDVTGANPTTGFGFTDQEGASSFCYAGDVVGMDTVRARTGDLADTSTVSWRAQSTTGGGTGTGGGGAAGPGPEPDVETAGMRTLTVSDATVLEGDRGNTVVSVTVSLSEPYPLGEDLGVELSVTSTGGSEVTIGSEQSFAQDAFADLVVKGGDTDAVVTLQILTDTTPEQDERIEVRVLSTTDPDLDIGQAFGTIVVEDDDLPVAIADLAPTSVSDMCLVNSKGPGLLPLGLVSPTQLADDLLSCAPDTPRTRLLVSRQDDFADALASGPLQSDSPLLLVPRGGPVPGVMLDRLSEENPEEIVILGGPDAVSEEVEAEFEAMGIRVTRRAGPTRIETAVDVAATDFADATTALVSRAFPGEGGDPTQAFADAIAAGAWAADERWPVLLTESTRLSDATRDHLMASPITHVKVMGGTAAISEEVVEEIAGLIDGTVERVGAPTRFATAVQISEERFGPDDPALESVILVEGTTPDAWMGGLTSAYLSAQVDAPVLLTSGDQVPEATGQYLADTDVSFAQALTAPQTSIYCVTTTRACLRGRAGLGLPGALVIHEPESGSIVDAGDELAPVVIPDVEASDITYGGSCLVRPTTDPAELVVRADGPVYPCTLTVTISFSSGVRQVDTALYYGR